MIDERTHEQKISAEEGGAFAYFVGQPSVLGRRWCAWVLIWLDSWQPTLTRRVEYSTPRTNQTTVARASSFRV